MNSFFSTDFFESNRRKLQELAGGKPIVIKGNDIVMRNGDSNFPFRQDSNFWYLTGLDVPGLTLVMDNGKTTVILPELSASEKAFNGDYAIESYQKISGIDRFVEANAPKNTRNTRVDKLLRDMRTLKQPQEIKAITESIRITSETLPHIAEHVLPAAKYEYVIEAGLTFGFRSQAANGHAFTPIVGAGKHATTLHYNANNGPIADDDLVVLDVGAEVENYAADITRTVSKQPISGRKADVFKAVETVQQEIIGLMKPGVSFRELELSTAKLISAELTKLGLDGNNVRKYYPHSVTHFMGLDVHDVGDYNQPLKPGMVITCEPGIYIPEEGIGVRIEDDVLITTDGNEVLSKVCPTRLTPLQSGQ